MAAALTDRRLAWLAAGPEVLRSAQSSILDVAYTVLLARLGVSPEEAPITDRGPRHLVFRSRNFCPTLEACRILGLDTRRVCKHLTEGPTNAMLRQIDPRLRFTRNYETLRPFGPYCEEHISLEE